jgi:hypothetical protein
VLILRELRRILSGARFSGRRLLNGARTGKRTVTRTWGMVARDWRGGKVFYREWSKLGVERTLGALNGEGSWEELAPEYWKTSRLSPVSPVSKIILFRSSRVVHPPFVTALAKIRQRYHFLLVG